MVLPRNVLRPYLEDGRLKEIPIGGVNLVHNNRYRELRNKIRAKLQKWIENTGDCFRLPPEDIVENQKRFLESSV